MKVDISVAKDETEVKITFFCDSFNGPKNYREAIHIVTCFSYEFDLDPELEAEDLEEIIEKTKELELDQFTFVISEEGIEVDIS